MQSRPFLKWAGGKSQLLRQFSWLYPPGLKGGEFHTYMEPFVGSGAVFFILVNAILSIGFICWILILI